MGAGAADLDHLDHAALQEAVVRENLEAPLGSRGGGGGELARKGGGVLESLWKPID